MGSHRCLGASRARSIGRDHCAASDRDVARPQAPEVARSAGSGTSEHGGTVSGPPGGDGATPASRWASGGGGRQVGERVLAACIECLWVSGIASAAWSLARPPCSGPAPVYGRHHARRWEIGLAEAGQRFSVATMRMRHGPVVGGGEPTVTGLPGAHRLEHTRARPTGLDRSHLRGGVPAHAHDGTGAAWCSRLGAAPG